MKSAARTKEAQTGTALPPKSFFAKTYTIGSISTPKSVPIKRQPKGVRPKREIPMEIISLPRGGWDIS